MTGRPQKVSARDEATILRLRRKMGKADLIRYVQSVPDRKANRKPSGAPRMKRTRQGLLAALYLFRECQSHATISAFAGRLPQVAEIKYSRRVPPVYITYKSAAALETDLRRGLQVNSEKDRRTMVDALLFWRFFHVNPFWPFGCGPQPHLLITPKKPAEIIRWIDATIKLSGVPEDVVKQRFHFQKVQ
jgi:hypothetical protein